jgi:hypothetical protein
MQEIATNAANRQEVISGGMKEYIMRGTLHTVDRGWNFILKYTMQSIVPRKIG